MVRGGVGKDPSGVPGGGYTPAWGNYGDDSFGECGVPTYNRFHMPHGRGASNAPYWYSFDAGARAYACVWSLGGECERLCACVRACVRFRACVYVCVVCKCVVGAHVCLFVCER